MLIQQAWEHRGELPHTGREPQLVLGQELLTHSWQRLQTGSLWAESGMWVLFHPHSGFVFVVIFQLPTFLTKKFHLKI